MNLRALAAYVRRTVVLTPQEKKAAWCVIGAFALGLATQQYRATHPRTPAATAVQQQPGKKNTARFQRVSPTPEAVGPPPDGEEE